MQSLVQTNDKAMRLSFKDALANKVKHSLTAPLPEQVKDSTTKVLFLPSNFQSLSEVELHFSLLHNKELKHSRESANMAVEIVHNKSPRPENVSFQTIDLKNPVTIPVFEKKTEVKRSTGRPLTPADSKAIKMAAEDVKRSEYHHYLANMFQRVDQPVEVRAETLRVPANWNELSEQELFFTLTHQTELEHTRTSAYRAMDILSGKIVKPTEVTLQEVVLFRPVSDPKPEFKVQTISKPAKQAKPIAEFAAQEEQILLLPKHYEELSEAGLFYTLTHNPELKHSPETAKLAIAFLNKVSSKPEWVHFQTVDLTKPEVVSTPQVEKKDDPLKGFIPERDLEKRAAHKAYLAGQAERALQPRLESHEEEIILRLPKNYKELSQDALLETLIRNEAYNHTRQSAYLALDIMDGKIAKPSNVKFHAVQLPKPVVKSVVLTDRKEAAPQIHPDILANEEAKKADYSLKLQNSPLRVSEPTEIVFRIPENYTELSNDELLYVLLNNTELAHDRKSAYQTIDILSGVIAKPANVTLQAVILEKPETVATPRVVEAVKPTPSLHPLQDETSTLKRNQHKEFLAEKARVAYNTKPVFSTAEVRTVLLPEGYESMNPGELHFALIRNPEFKHTNQQAVVTADMLSGRIVTPENVRFSTLAVANLQLAPTAKTHGPVEETNVKARSTEPILLTRAQLPTGEGSRILLLPENFESMSETQLHFALSHNREYGHSYESTYEAIDVVFGRKACPSGTVFHTVAVSDPVERAY